MKNPINQCNFFTTPKSYNDLVQWCERLSGGEKAVALMVMHMTLNLAHHVVQKAIDEESEK